LHDKSNAMESLLTYIRRMLQTQYSQQEIKALTSIICCDILGINAIDLYTGKDTDLSKDKMQKLQDIIKRLLHHEPIQYISGSTMFCGFNFFVSPDVLIPRPETEELVDLIVKENNGNLRILDIGTGSGCIAISINKKIPDTEVEGWDISSDALKIANANNTNLQTHVIFSQHDIFSTDFDNLEPYDIIVSNPPYVTESDKKDMQPEVLLYEPNIALFVTDKDPLRYYRRILQLSPLLLKKGGKLYFEINQKYGKQVYDLLQKNGFQDILIIKDIYQNERIVTAIL